MPQAAVNGVQLYYEERGSGMPILGIHGAGSSALFWEDAAEKLAELGRAVIYDRRGCTRSERPDPYEITSVQEHADDALALLRQLDAEPAILVGRSYGGTVALDLAIRHPDAVLGLALLEAGPIGLATDYDAWFGELQQTLEATSAARGADAVGEALLRAVFGAWEELPEAFREVFTANGQALLAEVRGGETTDVDRLGGIRTPTLVVTARDSPVAFRLASEAVARAIPNARSVLVEGGHAIDPAGPEVLAFVAELTHS
jgi:pimeloyl-ACP methyl ester carboxylesterase